MTTLNTYHVTRQTVCGSRSRAPSTATCAARFATSSSLLLSLSLPFPPAPMFYSLATFRAFRELPQFVGEQSFFVQTFFTARFLT